MPIARVMHAITSQVSCTRHCCASPERHSATVWWKFTDWFPHDAVSSHAVQGHVLGAVQLAYT